MSPVACEVWEAVPALSSCRSRRESSRVTSCGSGNSRNSKGAASGGEEGESVDACCAGAGLDEVVAAKSGSPPSLWFSLPSSPTSPFSFSSSALLQSSTAAAAPADACRVDAHRSPSNCSGRRHSSSSDSTHTNSRTSNDNSSLTRGRCRSKGLMHACGRRRSSSTCRVTGRRGVKVGGSPSNSSRSSSGGSGMGTTRSGSRKWAVRRGICKHASSAGAEGFAEETPAAAAASAAEHVTAAPGAAPQQQATPACRASATASEGRTVAAAGDVVAAAAAESEAAATGETRVSFGRRVSSSLLVQRKAEEPRELLAAAAAAATSCSSSQEEGRKGYAKGVEEADALLRQSRVAVGVAFDNASSSSVPWSPPDSSLCSVSSGNPLLLPVSSLSEYSLHPLSPTSHTAVSSGAEDPHWPQQDTHTPAAATGQTTTAGRAAAAESAGPAAACVYWNREATVEAAAAASCRGGGTAERGGRGGEAAGERGTVWKRFSRATAEAVEATAGEARGSCTAARDQKEERAVREGPQRLPLLLDSLRADAEAATPAVCSTSSRTPQGHGGVVAAGQCSSSSCKGSEGCSRSRSSGFSRRGRNASSRGSRSGGDKGGTRRSSSSRRRSSGRNEDGDAAEKVGVDAREEGGQDEQERSGSSCSNRSNGRKNRGQTSNTSSKSIQKEKSSRNSSNSVWGGAGEKVEEKKWAEEDGTGGVSSSSSRRSSGRAGKISRSRRRRRASEQQYSKRSSSVSSPPPPPAAADPSCSSSPSSSPSSSASASAPSSVERDSRTTNTDTQAPTAAAEGATTAYGRAAAAADEEARQLPKEADVLIVGAGPAGLTLALCCQLLGLSYACVDAKAEEARSSAAAGSRAILLHPRTLQIMQDVGVAEDLIIRGIRMRGQLRVLLERSLIAETPLSTLFSSSPSAAAAAAAAASTHAAEAAATRPCSGFAAAAESCSTIAAAAAAAVSVFSVALAPFLPPLQAAAAALAAAPAAAAGAVAAAAATARTGEEACSSSTPFPYALTLDQAVTEAVLLERLQQLGGKVFRPMLLWRIEQEDPDEMEAAAAAAAAAARAAAAAAAGAGETAEDARTENLRQFIKSPLRTSSDTAIEKGDSRSSGLCEEGEERHEQSTNTNTHSGYSSGSSSSNTEDDQFVNGGARAAEPAESATWEEELANTPGPAAEPQEERACGSSERLLQHLKQQQTRTHIYPEKQSPISSAAAVPPVAAAAVPTVAGQENSSRGIGSGRSDGEDAVVAAGGGPQGKEAAQRGRGEAAAREEGAKLNREEAAAAAREAGGGGGASERRTPPASRAAAPAESSLVVGGLKRSAASLGRMETLKKSGLSAAAAGGPTAAGSAAPPVERRSTIGAATEGAAAGTTRKGRGAGGGSRGSGGGGGRAVARKTAATLTGAGSRHEGGGRRGRRAAGSTTGAAAVEEEAAAEAARAAAARRRDMHYPVTVHLAELPDSYSLDDPKFHTMRCRYVVGCDGAKSLLRKVHSISFEVASPESEALDVLLADVSLSWPLFFPDTFAASSAVAAASADAAEASFQLPDAPAAASREAAQIVELHRFMRISPPNSLFLFLSEKGFLLLLPLLAPDAAAAAAASPPPSSASSASLSGSLDGAAASLETLSGCGSAPPSRSCSSAAPPASREMPPSLLTSRVRDGELQHPLAAKSGEDEEEAATAAAGGGKEKEDERWGQTTAAAAEEEEGNIEAPDEYAAEAEEELLSELEDFGPPDAAAAEKGDKEELQQRRSRKSQRSESTGRGRGLSAADAMLAQAEAAGLLRWRIFGSRRSVFAAAAAGNQQRGLLHQPSSESIFDTGDGDDEAAADDAGGGAAAAASGLFFQQQQHRHSTGSGAAAAQPHKARSEPVDDFEIIQLIENMLPGTVVHQVHWSCGFDGRCRVASRLQEKRCFLAGDAAHVFSPFLSEGLNLGIEDAYNLAWKLGSVLKGCADADVLTSYGQERLQAVREVERRSAYLLSCLFGDKGRLPLSSRCWLRVFGPLLSRAPAPVAAAMIRPFQTAGPYYLPTNEFFGAAGGREGPRYAAIGPGMLLPDCLVKLFPLGGRSREPPPSAPAAAAFPAYMYDLIGKGSHVLLLHLLLLPPGSRRRNIFGCELPHAPLIVRYSVPCLKALIRLVRLVWLAAARSSRRSSALSRTSSSSCSSQSFTHHPTKQRRIPAADAAGLQSSSSSSSSFSSAASRPGAVAPGHAVPAAVDGSGAPVNGGPVVEDRCLVSRSGTGWRSAVSSFHADAAARSPFSLDKLHSSPSRSPEEEESSIERGVMSSCSSRLRRSTRLLFKHCSTWNACGLKVVWCLHTEQSAAPASHCPSLSPAAGTSQQRAAAAAGPAATEQRASAGAECAAAEDTAEQAKKRGGGAAALDNLKGEATLSSPPCDTSPVSSSRTSPVCGKVFSCFQPESLAVPPAAAPAAASALSESAGEASAAAPSTSASAAASTSRSLAGAFVAAAAAEGGGSATHALPPLHVIGSAPAVAPPRAFDSREGWGFNASLSSVTRYWHQGSLSSSPEGSMSDSVGRACVGGGTNRGPSSSTADRSAGSNKCSSYFVRCMRALLSSSPGVSSGAASSAAASSRRQSWKDVLQQAPIRLLAAAEAAAPAAAAALAAVTPIPPRGPATPLPPDAAAARAAAAAHAAAVARGVTAAPPKDLELGSRRPVLVVLEKNSCSSTRSTMPPRLVGIPVEQPQHDEQRPLEGQQLLQGKEGEEQPQQKQQERAREEGNNIESCREEGRKPNNNSSGVTGASSPSQYEQKGETVPFLATESFEEAGRRPSPAAQGRGSLAGVTGEQQQLRREEEEEAEGMVPPVLLQRLLSLTQEKGKETEEEEDGSTHSIWMCGQEQQRSTGFRSTSSKRWTRNDTGENEEVTTLGSDFIVVDFLRDLEQKMGLQLQRPTAAHAAARSGAFTLVRPDGYIALGGFAGDYDATKALLDYSLTLF